MSEPRGSRVPPPDVSVPGVVPAAGASRRMGRPKGLLTLGEEGSFVRRVVRSLIEGGCDPVWLVTRPGTPELAREARAAGARVIENPEPGEGPITSLRLALRELADRPVAYVAYLPVDHPRVQPETVAALIAVAGGAAGAGVAPPLVAPVHGGKRGHPVLLGRTLFAELLDPDLEGGARTVVHRHLEGARLVEVDDPGVVIDVDTPEEYRALLDERSASTGEPG